MTLWPSTNLNAMYGIIGNKKFTIKVKRKMKHLLMKKLSTKQRE